MVQSLTADKSFLTFVTNFLNNFSDIAHPFTLVAIFHYKRVKYKGNYF